VRGVRNWLQQAGQAIDEVEPLHCVRLTNGGQVHPLVPVQQLVAVAFELAQLAVAERQPEGAR
jgi:hypothetical protein